MNGLTVLLVGVSWVAVAFSLWRLRQERLRRSLLEAEWQTRSQAQGREQDRADRRFEQLAAALDVLHRFGVTSSALTDWAEGFLASAASVTHCAQLVLLVWDPERKALLPLASRGVAPEFLQGLSVQPGIGALGRAALQREPSEIDNLEQAGAQGRFSVWPLRTQDQPAALLLLGEPPAEISDDAQARLRFLVRQANLALANLQLMARLTQSDQDLVQTLARTIDARDAYTHQHSNRTRALVRAMGEENQLPAQLIAIIEQGGLLHDLGKIGIDDAILRKPGKLTPEEYDFMKRHPAIGYRILQPVPFLRPAASIVLYHQEWYNGQGYPEGLAGEEIPLGARLISVIDAWDAMTSNRPYRNAMPKSAAIAELRRQAGTQFDPKMVDTFLKVIDRLERQGVAITEMQEAQPAG